MKKLKIYLLAFLSILCLVAVGQPKITISEINYKSDKSMNSEDWVEIWNYGNTTVNLSNWVLQGEKFNEIYIIPSSTELGPDKRLVFARDKVMFNQIHPDVQALGPFVFRLSGKGQNIRLYDNTNTLLQEVWYRDTLPWPKTPDGHGKTLQIIDPEGDLNDGTNWMADCILGSPGKAPGNCARQLVFSEIYTANLPPWDSGDWVELYNSGSTPMDISNWTFKNRNDTLEFVLPSNTVVGPGERIVLNRRDKYFDYHGNSARFFGPFEFGIRASSDVLRLYDQNGKIYNSMFFQNVSPWPTEPQVQPNSIVLRDAGKSLCSAGNWRLGCWGGAPGIECFAVSVEENNSLANTSIIYPNPLRQNATIETTAENLQPNQAVDFQVFDFTGKLSSASQAYDWAEINHDGSGKIILNFQRNGLPPGFYIYRLTQAENVLASGKMMVVD